MSAGGRSRRRLARVLRAAALVMLPALRLGGCAGLELTGTNGALRPTIAFVGSEAFPDAALRSQLSKQIDEAHENGFRKADVDDLAFEVELLLRGSGYHFVETSYEHGESGATITIRDGPRVVIDGQLEFPGATAFSRTELDAMLVSSLTALVFGDRIFVEQEVLALRGAIEDAYLERGFLSVVVAPAEIRYSDSRDRASISMKIDEGPQSVVRHLDLSRVGHVDRALLEKRVAYLLGSAYVPRLRYELETVIEEIFAEAAFPEAVARVEIEERARDAIGSDGPGADPERSLALVASVEPGPRVRIGRVEVRGAVETEPQFIAGRVLVEPGMPFDGALIRRSFRRVFETGLFRSVDLRLEDPALVGTESSAGEPSGAPSGGSRVTDADGFIERTLVVEVVEQATLDYFFELGFGSYDLARGRAGVRETNLFGRALIGRAEALVSIRGLQTTVGVTDPWVLGSEWSLDLPVSGLYRQEPSFTLFEGRVGLRLARPITRELDGGFAYRFSISEIEEFDVAVGVGEEPDLQVGAVGPFLEYDTRDDLFQPRRGMRTRLFGEFGSQSLGGEIEFVHSGFSTSHYFELFDGTVLAGTIQSEWIHPIGPTRSIPIQERLFLGGENGVRSFRQSEVGPKDSRGKPFGGEVRNFVSIEWRQRIWESFSIGVFGDYGNVAVSSERPFEDFRPGVGLGVRYGLPIGPIRIDAAYNPDRRRGEDLIVVQFAVGLAY